MLQKHFDALIDPSIAEPETGQEAPAAAEATAPAPVEAPSGAEAETSAAKSAAEPSISAPPKPAEPIFGGSIEESEGVDASTIIKQDDGTAFLVPGIDEQGNFLSEKEARAQWKRSGANYGLFASEKEARRYQMERMTQEGRARMRTAFLASKGIDPAKIRKDREIAERMGLDPYTVHYAYERLADIDLADQVAQYEGLQRYASRSQFHAAYIRGNFENLKAVEEFDLQERKKEHAEAAAIRRENERRAEAAREAARRRNFVPTPNESSLETIRQAWARSGKQAELAEASQAWIDAREAGDAAGMAEARKRADALSAELAHMEKWAENDRSIAASFGAHRLAEQGQTSLPIMGKSLQTGLAGAGTVVLGAAGWGAIAGAGAGGVGAAPGAVAAATASLPFAMRVLQGAALAEGAVETFKLERNLLLPELMQEKDAEGKSIDDEIIYEAATIHGAVAAGLEVVTEKVLLGIGGKALHGLSLATKDGSKELARAMAKDPALRKSIKAFLDSTGLLGKSMVKAAAAEGGAEGGQEASSVLNIWLARVLSNEQAGGKFDESVLTMDNMKRIAESGRIGAGVGAALAFIPGLLHAGSYYARTRRASRMVETERARHAVIEKAKKADPAKDPQAMEEAVATISPTTSKTVSIPMDEALRLKAEGVDILTPLGISEDAAQETAAAGHAVKASLAHLHCALNEEQFNAISEIWINEDGVSASEAATAGQTFADAVRLAVEDHQYMKAADAFEEELTQEQRDSLNAAEQELQQGIAEAIEKTPHLKAQAEEFGGGLEKVISTYQLFLRRASVMEARRTGQAPADVYRRFAIQSAAAEREEVVQMAAKMNAEAAAGAAPKTAQTATEAAPQGAQETAAEAAAPEPAQPETAAEAAPKTAGTAPHWAVKMLRDIEDFIRQNGREPSSNAESAEERTHARYLGALRNDPELVAELEPLDSMGLLKTPQTAQEAAPETAKETAETAAPETAQPETPPEAAAETAPDEEDDGGLMAWANAAGKKAGQQEKQGKQELGKEANASEESKTEQKGAWPAGADDKTKAEAIVLAESVAEELAETAPKTAETGAKAAPETAAEAAKAEPETTQTVEAVKAGPVHRNKGGKPVRAEGREATLYTLSGEERVRYEVRELADVVPSHDPSDNFKWNSSTGQNDTGRGYPRAAQERQYQSTKESDREQQKVREHAADFKPGLLLGMPADASTGAPVILKEGYVVGGNSRTMSLQLVYEEQVKLTAEREKAEKTAADPMTPEKERETAKAQIEKIDARMKQTRAAKYKGQLAKAAPDYGISREAVEGMERPILVRVMERGVDVTDDNALRNLSSELNKSMAQDTTASTQAISGAARVTPEAIAAFAEGSRAFESTEAFLKDEASIPFVEKLKDTLIDRTKVTTYLDRKEELLSEEGRKYVTGAMRALVVDDYDTLANASDAAGKSILNKIGRALPEVMRLKAAGGAWAKIADAIKPAVNQINKWMAGKDSSGKPHALKDIERHFSAGSLVRDAERESTLVQILATALARSAPVEFRTRIAAVEAEAQYAAEAKGREALMSLLSKKQQEVQTAEAFVRAFLSPVILAGGRAVRGLDTQKNPMHAALKWAGGGKNAGSTFEAAQKRAEAELEDPAGAEFRKTLRDTMTEKTRTELQDRKKELTDVLGSMAATAQDKATAKAELDKVVRALRPERERLQAVLNDEKARPERKEKAQARLKALDEAQAGLDALQPEDERLAAVLADPAALPEEQVAAKARQEAKEEAKKRARMLEAYQASQRLEPDAKIYAYGAMEPGAILKSRIDRDIALTVEREKAEKTATDTKAPKEEREKAQARLDEIAEQMKTRREMLDIMANREAPAEARKEADQWLNDNPAATLWQKAIRFFQQPVPVPKEPQSKTVLFQKQRLEALREQAPDPLMTEPRGCVTAGKDGNFYVEIFKGSDLSTILHEASHMYFLSMERHVEAGIAPEAIKEDWNRLKAWAGVKDGQALSAEEHRDMHEKLAAAFEVYMAEGNAPAVGLRKAFQRIRSWMLRIYGEISRLGVELTPEIRGVFDRMIATQEEIEIAAARDAVQSGFTQERMDDLQMTAAERAYVRNLQAFHKSEAGLKLYVKWEKKRKARIEKHRKKATAEIEADPIRQAVAGIAAQPLDRTAVRNLVGEEMTAQLEAKGIPMTEDGTGTDPGIYAGAYGYEPEDLLRAIRDMKPADEAIEERVNELEAAHTAKIDAYRELRRQQMSDTVADIIAGHLSKVSRRDYISADVIKASAANQFRAMPIAKALDTQLFLDAMNRANKKAMKCIAEKRFDEAYTANVQVRLNSEWARLSERLADEIEGATDMVQRLCKNNSAGAAAKALAAQKALAFGLFGPRPPARILRAAGYDESGEIKQEVKGAIKRWRERLEANGFNAEIMTFPEPKQYTEMTMDDVQEFLNAIKAVATADRNERHMLADEKQELLKDVVDELTATAAKTQKANGGAVPHGRHDTTEVRRRARWFHAAHMKIEMLCIMLDGGKRGAFWNRIYKPISDAADNQAIMAKKARDFFNKLYARHYPSLGVLRKKTFEDAIGRAMTHEERLAVALNMGNAGNQQRLRDGFNWNDAQITAILKPLTENDWRFVQEVWDYLESFKEEDFRIDEILTGARPDEVQPVPLTVQTADGKTLRLRGGYYRIKYDPLESRTVQEFEEDAQLAGQMSRRSKRARRGSLKARTDRGAGTALRLDLGVLHEAVAEQIHRISHQLALHDVSHILRNKEVQTAIEDTLGGTEYTKNFDAWLKDCANEDIGDRSPQEKMFSWARAATTIMMMGYKFTTIWSVPAGITQTINEIGTAWTACGLWHVIRVLSSGGWSGGKAFLEETRAKSKMMATRIENFDRDVRDYGKRLDRGPISGWAERVRGGAFMPMAYFQLWSVDLPTWWGAYEKTLKELQSDLQEGKITGEDAEAKAVEAADSTVRLTQASGATKDLASIQRGGEAKKLLTMFYSYFNTLYNLGAKEIDALRHNHTPSGIWRAANSALVLWFLPSVMAEWLAGRGPDDDEEWLKWASKIWLQFPFQSMVGARDVVQAFFSPFDYQLTPAAQALKSIVTLWKKADKAIEERDPSILAKPTAEAIGYAYRLPLKQILITAGNMWDFCTDPNSEFYFRDLFYTKPKSRRDSGR